MRYKKDSIQEALCEMNFIPGGEPWDLTYFGRFFELTKTDYPKRKNQENIEMSLELGPTGPKHTVTKSPKMLFLASDEKSLIQLSENQLVANVLRPYPHWDTFRGKILSVYANYKKVIPGATLSNFVLRYIDRWDFEKPGFELAQFFSLGPQSKYLPACLAPVGAPCMLRFQTPLGDDLILDLSFTMPPDEGKAVTALDTRLIKTKANTDEEEFEKALEVMHKLLTNIYEDVVNDHLRTRMEPV